MSVLTDDLLNSLAVLLKSGNEIPASDLRAFEAQVIAAIAVLETRARGNRIFYTSGKPGDALGIDGDLGVNKGTGDFYAYAGGTFTFLFNGAGKAGLFTPIEANAFGTHPAFTNQAELNQYLLAHQGTGVVTPIVPAPTITSFTPTTAAEGATVTITGTNYGAAPGTAGTVKFNGILANIVSWSNGIIKAKVPVGGATGVITVTTAGGSIDSSGSFTVSVPASGAPAAPGNPAVDDTNNVFAVDVVSGYAALAQYRYSTNGGVSFINGGATGSVLSLANGRVSLAVGNVALAVGKVLIGVDALNGNQAGATTANGTAFTVTAAPSGGVNIVCHGNSITFGAGAGGSNAWPAKLQVRLGSGYVVTNSGNSGHTLENMVSELPSLVFANYNANAAYNVLFVQEQVNSLRGGDSASEYYNLLLSYCNQVKSKAGQTWIIVPVTGTPTTVGGAPYTNSTDINAVSQIINSQMLAAASQNGATAAWTANHVLNLAKNRRVGQFGSAAEGQDAGYSSYSTVYYADGTHPTERGNEVIAHMAYDMVSYIVSNVAIPNQSNYPDTAPQGTACTFQDVNGNNTVTGNSIYCNGGQFMQARTVEALTAGTTGAAKELRGSFFATANGGNPGFFGVGANGVNSPWQWIQYGDYMHGGHQMYSNGGGASNNSLNQAAGVSGTVLHYDVYADGHAELFFDDVFQVASPAGTVGFPCYGDFSLEPNAGYSDVRIVAVL